MGQTNSTSQRNGRRAQQGNSQPGLTQTQSTPSSQANSTQHRHQHQHQHQHQHPVHLHHARHGHTQLPSASSSSSRQPPHPSSSGQRVTSAAMVSSATPSTALRNTSSSTNNNREPTGPKPMTGSSGSNSTTSGSQTMPPSSGANSSSRVLRSTTERRRRTNLFSGFYPLLPRSSSSNNSGNGGNGNTSNSGNLTSNGSPSTFPGGTTDNSMTVPALSTRSRAATTGNPSTSNLRTPRGLSRVQRMADEQSIRSTRSSSRASSIVGVAPPVSVVHPIELMDIDHESVGLVPQSSTINIPSLESLEDSSVLHRRQRLRGGPRTSEIVDHTGESRLIPSSASTLSVGSTSSAQLLDDSTSTQRRLRVRNLLAPTDSMEHTGESQLLSSSASITSIGSSSSANPRSHSRLDYTPARVVVTRYRSSRNSTQFSTQQGSSSRTGDVTIQQDGHHDRVYPSFSNPRGGTSISSSLLPIHPESDDDDFGMHVDGAEHEGSASQGADGEPPGPRRRNRPAIDPEDLVDIIRRQFMHMSQPPQSSGRSSTSVSARQSTSSRPQLDEPSEAIMNEENSSTTSVETLNNVPANLVDVVSDNGSTGSTQQQTDRAVTDTGGFAYLNRRRARSSSLRGLLGFQPTRDDQPGQHDGEPATAAIEPEWAPFIQPQTGVDDSDSQQRPSQQQQQGQEQGAGQGTQQLPTNISRILGHLRTMLTSSPEINAALRQQMANSDDQATNSVTSGESMETGSANSVPGAPMETRARPALRFIPLSGTFTSRARSTSVGETDGEQGAARPAHRREANSAIFFFVAGPPSQSGSDGQATEGRRDHPQLVWMTFPEAYLSSLLSGGPGGEMNYEELLALSSLIGPARPITTTQEAINNAGFHVGQFDVALQGMRDCSTLGDATKCLVCMSNYEEGEDLRALNCKHGFHQECIDKWLTTGANKCPVCRSAAVVSAETRPTPPAAAEGTVNE